MSSWGDGGGDRASDLVVASAADSRYFPLLQDAVLSVRALRPEVAIGILDLGLGADERAWLEGRVSHVVRPQWDFDFPGRARAPEALKAELARPFLPKYFPGYRMYLWLDADAWVQDWRIVELYCNAAGRGKLAITPEIDRAYKRHYKRPKLFGMNLGWKNYRRAFGWRVADRLGRNPTVNGGVLALHAEAPHWVAWRRVLTGVLQRTSFTPAGQTALNYVVFAEHLPVNFLPAYCNWMPGDAAPAFDAERGLFVEPYAPHQVIGVMHLAGAEQKSLVFRLPRLDGGTVETALRYGATRELCGRALALST
jgi:hypothetical protein